MKYISTAILLLCCLAAFGQQRSYFMIQKGSATTTSDTVVKAIHISFINEYRDENEYSGIQGVNYPGSLPYTKNDLKDTTGTASTVDLIVSSGALVSATSAPDGGLDPSADNVYCKEFVAGLAWRFTSGEGFTLAGLPASRHVKLYFLANAHAWEAPTGYFTANGTSTSNVNTANNQGTCAGDKYTDPALRSITVLTNGSGEINITCTQITDVGYMVLNSLYIQVLSN